MFIPRKMSQTQKQLQEIYSSLDKAGQDTLLAFAEFLLARSGDETSSAPIPLPEPNLVPRPGKESVVAAIKRLSASYSMLDKPELLNETSVLMTQHVMQGRTAIEVIDELEALFQRFYQELVDSVSGEQP